MDNTRQNLPSASGMERLFLCPGSFALEQTQPDERSADSASGDRAHNAAANYFRSFGDADAWPIFPDDGSEESEVAQRFVSMAADVFERWFSYTVPPQKIVEERLVMFERGEVVTTGQPDVVFIDGDRALILDLKSLWGDHTESVRNIQLRTYAALVVEEHGVSEVTVAICQPRVSSKPQMAKYDEADLALARTEILSILACAEDPNAPRVPGEKQCKFCRARAVCPEANATVTTLATLHTPGIEPVDLLKMLEVVGPAKKVIAALEARAKHLLEANPDALPGWTLEAGAQRRSIRDPRAAFAQLSNVVSAEEFTECCTVKISELEKRFTATMREKTSLKAGECRNQFEQLLAGIIEKKATAPSLARAPLALEQAA